MATHRIMKTYMVDFKIEGFSDQIFSRVVLAKSKKNARQALLKQEKKTKAAMIVAVNELK